MANSTQQRRAAGQQQQQQQQHPQQTQPQQEHLQILSNGDSSSNSSNLSFIPVAILEGSSPTSTSVVVVTDPQTLRRRPTRSTTGMSEVSLRSEGSTSSLSLSLGSHPPSPTSAKSSHSNSSSSGGSGSGAGSRKRSPECKRRMTRKKNQKRREAAKTKRASSRSNSDASMDMTISPTESTETEHTAITSITTTTASTTARSSSDEALPATVKVDTMVSPDSGSQADEESDGSGDDHFDDVNDQFEANESAQENPKAVGEAPISPDLSSVEVTASEDSHTAPAEKVEEGQEEEAAVSYEEASAGVLIPDEDSAETKDEPVVDFGNTDNTALPHSSETVNAQPITTATDETAADTKILADIEISADSKAPAVTVSGSLQEKALPEEEEEEEEEVPTPVSPRTAALAATNELDGVIPADDTIAIPQMTMEADGLPSSDHDVWAANEPAAKDTVEASKELESVEAVANGEEESISTEMPDGSSQVEQEPPVSHEPVKANYINEGRVISNESISNLPSMDAASEAVATVAIQCLERDKDMELSYVAILSAITVLKQRKEDPTPLSEDQQCKISALYSHIIQLCTQDSARDGLAEETVRQGVLTPESLYFQIYHSILDAGFQLEEKDHLAISKIFLFYKRADKAIQALEYIPADRWRGAEYRQAIQCRMASKPRQQADIDDLLAKYQSSEDQSMTPFIREWYRLCQQSAKWEDTKTQYERRRTRLVEAPNNIERLSNVSSIPNTSIDLGSSPITSPHSGKHERSLSSGSTSTTASSPGHQRTTSSSSHQRTPSVTATAWPSGAPASLSTASAPPAAASKGPFSFLSNFKFPGTGSKAAAQDQQAATLPSSIHVNHHLTVLDNNMLEECVKFKEFEYGWKRIYERMGAQLEDKDTAKIVMRLCKRAFLGFGGPGPEAPGSPNVQAKDMFDQEGDAALHIAEAIRQVAPSDRSLFTQDPEIWEARAWAVYNKAMMNPQALGTSSHHPHHHNPHHTGIQAHGSQAVATSSVDPNQPIASLNSHTAMSVFLHDILTIATCSPEKSSRYLKAYRVYTSMRSDPALHLQLRDPFVMKVVLKAIYDSVLSIVRAQEQGIELEPPVPAKDEAESSSNSPLATKTHRRRSSTCSLGRVQAMSIGPLLDLAFEIYADLRDTGSIRQLLWESQASNPGAAPTTPAVRTAQGHLALFFNPSSSSSTTEPPAANIEAGTAAAAAASNAVDLSNTLSITTSSASPRTSLSGAHIPVFQKLSPLLVPSPHARILPNEIYLALLHLCIQVPVWEISSQVVQTIVSDMRLGMEREGDYKFVVDGDIAAALQCFHDTWMCATAAGSEKKKDAEENAEEDKEGRCSFQAWMYCEAQEQEIEDVLTGLEAPSCNPHEYWGLWSRQDSRLTRLVYSPSRIAKLVEHVDQALASPTTN